MAFDPKAFLSQEPTTTSGFDPKAFLAGSPNRQTRAAPSGNTLESTRFFEAPDSWKDKLPAESVQAAEGLLRSGAHRSANAFYFEDVFGVNRENFYTNYEAQSKAVGFTGNEEADFQLISANILGKYEKGKISGRAQGKARTSRNAKIKKFNDFVGVDKSIGNVPGWLKANIASIPPTVAYAFMRTVETGGASVRRAAGWNSAKPLRIMGKSSEDMLNAAKKIRSWDELSPEFQQSYTGAIAQAAADMVPILVVGATTRNPQMATRTAVMMFGRAAAGASEEYRNTVPEDEQHPSTEFAYMMASGTAEMLFEGLTEARILKRIGGDAGEGFAPAAIKNFLLEGGSEVLTGLAQDASAKGLFDEDRELWSDQRLKEFLAGGLMATAMTTGVEAGAKLSQFAFGDKSTDSKAPLNPMIIPSDNEWDAIRKYNTDEQISEWGGKLALEAANGDVTARGDYTERVLSSNILAEADERVQETQAQDTQSTLPTVALNKAEIEQAIELSGREDLQPVERRGLEQSLNEAQEQKLDERAESVADEIIQKPRSLTDQEHAGMVLRLTQLYNNYEGLLKESSEAAETGNPDRAKQLMSQADSVFKRIDKLERASDQAGSEAGRQLNARKMRMKKEDYSLAKTVQRATAHKGSPLTQAELKLLQRLTDKIASQERRIKDLQAKIDAIEDGKIPDSLKDRMIKALVEHKQNKRKIEQEIDKFREKDFWEKAADIVSLPRTLIATADMSAVLRQGLLLSARRPRTAIKAFGQSFKAFFSQYKADEIDLALRSRPTYENGQKAGLYLTPMDRIDMAAREETFMSNLAERIPAWGKVVIASERNMVTHLNLLRAAAFDQFVQQYPNATKQQLEAWAKYVNAASGRGTLGKFEASTRALSVLMFSPRFAVSRFQAPYRMIQNLGTPIVRKEIAKDFAGLMGLGITVLTLAGLAGAEIGTDPEESDWGKIVIGNTRIDIWGGFQQPARLVFTWMNTNKYSDANTDPMYATMQFAKYKLSPQVSIPVELWTGENAIGEDVEFWQTAYRSITPLMIQDTAEVLMGSNPENVILTTPAAFFGAGVGEHD